MSPYCAPRLFATGLVALSCWQCSGSSTTAPTPSLITIAIAPVPDVLLIGGAVPLVATNVATGEILNVQWSINSPTFASASNGQLVALAAGRVVVTAAYQGARATVGIKIVPNYSGKYPSTDLWGMVFKTDCVELTATSHYCPTNVADPEIFHLELVQTKGLVSGRCQTDAVSGVLSGEIDDLGSLTLLGTLPSLDSHGASFPFQKVVSWSSYLDKQGAMYGTFTSQFLARDGTGLFQVTQEIRGMSHSL